MYRCLILFLVISQCAIAQEWITNVEAARKIAQEEDKMIVLVFQGSDWCAPCIKLDREVWSTNTFKTYAKEHYVMLQADFPRKKKNALPESLTNANAQLAEMYNPNGIFPFVVVLDKTGKVLGQTSYKKTTPTEYIKTLESFKG